MPSRTTRSVLANYLASQGVIAAGEPPDRWYAGNWIYLRLGNRRVPFFPLIGIRRPTMLHDLNHLLSNFDTSWRGEFAVAGWELTSGGCGRFLYFWVDRLFFVAIGTLIAPLPTLRGLRSGSGCRNTYRLDPDTILELSFLELQRYARVECAA
jgi:hypothetical protein